MLTFGFSVDRSHGTGQRGHRFSVLIVVVEYGDVAEWRKVVSEDLAEIGDDNAFLKLPVPRLGCAAQLDVAQICQAE